MRKLCVCGIDPGVTGGLVVIDYNHKVLYMQAFDGFGDTHLSSHIRSVSEKFSPQAFIKEEFHSYGVHGKTAFTVGRLHGIIDLVIRERGIRQINVRAKEWQREVHLKGNKDLKPKSLSLLTVEGLFPGVEFRTKTKSGKLAKNPHDGLIDASLIALAGLRLLLKEINAPSEA